MKGREFEDYVLSLFNIQEGGELVLQEWQGDKSYGMLQPENNGNPDFVFRYKKMEFAVECKWRDKISRDLSKDLFPIKKIKKYQAFSEVRHMPVTIVLGVGGDSSNPELLYIIPLKKIASIISGDQSIVDYLYHLPSFNVSIFLQQEEEKKLKDKHDPFPNAYKPWSNEEDKLLITLHHEKRNIKELMSIFNHTKGAISSRIKKLKDKDNGGGII